MCRFWRFRVEGLRLWRFRVLVLEVEGLGIEALEV